MISEILTVGLGGRSYDILIGDGIIARAGGEMRQRLGQRKVIIVADENAARYHLAPLIASLNAADLTVADPILIPPGEASKSFGRFELLCEQILALKPDRSTILVALGGGVVGDLTGFTAATLLRGVDFVQIPTTLLSQVDSSVGGKTGINAKAGKNLIGAFHQPRLVLSDIATLRTLPAREILSGYAEVVKHALIVDPAFFAYLEQHGAALIGGDEARRLYAVKRSCEIKADIVAHDETEQGDRALLNFGHTFGHALEALTGYGEIITHGEGVAIGCILAFDLSVRLGLCPPDDATRVIEHFKTAGLPTSIGRNWGIREDVMIAAMRGDKKNSDDKIRFILTRGIGQAFRSPGIEEANLHEMMETQLN